LDPQTLQKYYETTNLSSSDYFDNGIVIAEFDNRREWSALGKPTDRAAWEMSAPTVNAYYEPAGNEIVFPAGIMQFPVFDVNVPEYLSYGAFGSVSGHELSHGIFCAILFFGRV
jgi:endothelin-converting enzyme